MASSLVATWHPPQAPALRPRRIRTRRLVSYPRCALDERTVIESYGSLNGSGNGNGRAGAAGGGETTRYNEERRGKEEEIGLNGSENGNGGMIVKYDEAAANDGAAFKPAEATQVDERARKKRIEDIGREDAWFKTQTDGTGQQPQV